METNNKTLLLVMVVGMAMILLLEVGTAYAETTTWRYESEETNMIAEITQDSEDYNQMWITIADGEEDFAVRVTIYGHPMRSESLENVLRYFGLTDCWSGFDGSLDYQKILFQLGLDEGNL